MGSIPSSAQWVKGSGVAAGMAQVKTLAQELLYDMGKPLTQTKSCFNAFITEK